MSQNENTNTFLSQEIIRRTKRADRTSDFSEILNMRSRDDTTLPKKPENYDEK